MKKYILIILSLILILSACGNRDGDNEEIVVEEDMASKYAPIVGDLNFNGEDFNREDIFKAIEFDGLDGDQYDLSFVDEKNVPDGSEGGEFKVGIRVTYSDGSKEDFDVNVKIEVDDGIYSLFSGREVSEEVYKSRPLMFTIDNHHDARPQSSLSKASIIWEIRVEGDYTRYLALFERPEEGEGDFLVGPIRSARKYFAQRVRQFNGIFTHHGGSVWGYEEIRKLALDDLDGMNLSGVIFFRKNDTGKWAPHNSYANIDDVYSYVNRDGGRILNEELNGFEFNRDFIQPDGDGANLINISYRKGFNEVRYEYDEESKSYVRYRENEKMVDETSGDLVKPTNIIIIEQENVVTSSGVRSFNIFGQGKGKYISGGKLVDITWSNGEDNLPSEIFYGDGSKVKLNPGQTWIQVVDPSMEIIYE